jgi:hypothetical protein
VRHAPFAVVILPYAVELDGEVRHAVFRTPTGRGCCSWHALAGTGTRRESPLDAARREALQAARIPPDAAYLALDSRASLEHGDAPVAIAEFAFGVRVWPDELSPPDPELEVRWVPYEIANGLLWREADRNALWELRRRLGRPAACR